MTWIAQDTGQLLNNLRAKTISGKGPKMNCRATILTSLLLVIMTIGLVACTSSQYTKLTPAQRIEMHDAREVGLAYQLYLESHDGELPQNLYALASFLNKPINLKQFSLVNHHNIQNVKQITKPEQFAIVESRPTTNQTFRAVVYADGRVEAKM
ncbi:hypothetical protein [Poriferisphaera sp. WC338]|uniref:hypothetical protein n=1 Tax=Poriferisphaera sp. WC338 TaxID=3425129 RepID=UPI003D814EEA